jgi:SAM-dependent methyltransferase
MVGKRKLTIRAYAMSQSLSSKETIAGEKLRSAATAADFLAAWLNHRLLSTDSQKLVDDYYRSFQGMRSPRMRHWYNSQVMEAEAIVRQKPGLRVLEIGVGSGSEFLWWGMCGAKVTGIDVFPNCVATTLERLEVLQRLTGRVLDCSAKAASITEFQDADGFDLIWMEQAFHHLEPRAEVVEKISSLLRPGGHVVLSEANALNPLLQYQMFRVRGFKTIVNSATERGPMVWGDERILWRGALASWFRQVGIDQESARYFRIFPSNAVFERLFWLERRISSQWLAPLFSHYNFVGRKRQR